MQNLGGLVSKCDSDEERVVTRRLITQATDCYQLLINKARPTVCRMPSSVQRTTRNRVGVAVQLNPNCYY